MVVGAWKWAISTVFRYKLLFFHALQQFRGLFYCSASNPRASGSHPLRPTSHPLTSRSHSLLSGNRPLRPTNHPRTSGNHPLPRAKLLPWILDIESIRMPLGHIGSWLFSGHWVFGHWSLAPATFPWTPDQVGSDTGKVYGTGAFCAVAGSRPGLQEQNLCLSVLISGSLCVLCALSR